MLSVKEVMKNQPCWASAVAIALVLSLGLSAQGNRGAAGEWGGVIQWPHVPAHIAQLNDGRMLTWAAATADDFNLSSPNFTVSAIYDPSNGKFQSTNNPRQNMFCAGLSRTIDGKVLAVGGGAATYLASLFNPANNSWVATGSTARRRWYNTNVTLPSGNVFIALGAGEDTLTELWSPASNIWTPMWNVDFTPILNDYKLFSPEDYEWYPWLHVAPNGKLFYSGPTTKLYWVDPTGGSSNNVAVIGPRIDNDRMRLWGTAMMYRPGQLLITGGRDMTLSPPATNEAIVINLNGAAPTVQRVAPMNYARVFHQALTLPNGEVLAVGGNTSALKFTDEGAILTPEIWSPAINQWRLVAPMSVARPYHSTAALMVDGRVIIIGGGTCGPCGSNHPDGQIYSPSYLFNADGTVATRPAVHPKSVPNQIHVGASFTVTGSDGINAFTMIRLQATTHGMQSDHRFLPLAVTGINRSTSRIVYTLATNSNPNLLLPGDYWLFGINANGTPSVGSVIRVTP